MLQLEPLSMCGAMYRTVPPPPVTRCVPAYVARIRGVQPLFMFVGIASTKALNLASDRRPRGLEDAAPAGGHVEDEAYSAWEAISSAERPFYTG